MKLYLLRWTGMLFFGMFITGISQVFCQSAFDPNDPIVLYNSTNPPDQPDYGQVGKWVKTTRLNWSTTAFKAYIYKGMPFRLKYPKSYVHGVSDGKKYPVFVFFHGVGERGTIYDNEFQLYHGGSVHLSAVNNGKFDGFLLYPQNTNGYFNINHYDFIDELIENFMVPEIKVDINKIYIDGLSGGGTSSWDFMFRHPKLVAASLPISSASLYNIDKLDSWKYIPVWHFQGALDRSPHPNTSHQILNAANEAGANYRYTEYAGQGHGCWNSAWAEADFYPFLNRAHKANAWPLTGRTEFCPEDQINVTLGLTAGFDGYEWRKNGIIIPGANSNELVVNSLGVYDCRILRGTEWSVWSPTPVVIKIKGVTVSPPITVSGIMSNVLPALDGNTFVTLAVPSTYASYIWQKVGDTTTIGVNNTVNALTPGDYIVKVTEKFGCSSNFSDPFHVVDANGANKPDPAINLSVSTISKTALRLDWSDNPTPINNETNFEIYQGSQAGGPYKLIAITGRDITNQTINELETNTRYYYKIRAVNNSAAATASNEANGTTAADTQAPTAPTDLVVAGTTRNSISLTWSPSSDDVEVTKYDIFINGQKSFVSTTTQFTAYNLEDAKSYNFAVRARDFANNSSPLSNQVTGQTLLLGLNYKYYTFSGTWSNLPDFSTLTPQETGVVTTANISDRTQDDNFAYLWEGYITIPVNGTYYFRTTSDAGSRLYLGGINQTASPYSFDATPLVNNDGIHNTQTREASITLTAGRYPIAISYFEQTGSQSFSTTWRIPQSGNNFVSIPASAFADPPVVNGVAPVSPSGLSGVAVSSKRIDLAWTDNSNNETGFEVWRSSSASTGFATVATVGANVTSYMDSTLDPLTTYYYRLRAIGQYGESEFTSKLAEVNWKFNNNYTDASGFGRTLSTAGSPVFDVANKQEGTHSVRLNGTNQNLTISNSGGFLQTAFSERTIAFWMRSNSNTSNRIILDLGGSDDGLALMLNSNNLIAGIAANNTRSSISASYTSTDWRHIALVYNKSSLRLYVNGMEVASRNNLAFTTTTTTTNGSRIGANSGSNAFNTTSNLNSFNGWIDNFGIYNTAFSVEEINALQNGIFLGSTATTWALPSQPLAATNLVATAVSPSEINITWDDNAGNEEKYELYRSVNNNSNYVLLATLPLNSGFYKDSSLFANALYYYKVRPVNIAGATAFSNEQNARTLNNIPVLATVPNKYIRYDTQFDLNVQATDGDPEALVLNVTNLPPFASFTSTGNGAGVIHFAPAQPTNQGFYENITISVTDQHSGSSSVSFNLTVNDNYEPDITGTSNLTVNEKQSAQVTLSATDQNAGDNLSWSFTGLPSFASVATNAANVQINFAPSFTDAGTYKVNARIDDGKNGFDTTSFVITVVNTNPNKKVFINFNSGNNAPAPWNNTNKAPALNDNFSNLLFDNGTNSGMGMLILTPWQNIGNGSNTSGVNTLNNSGVYPDAVINSAYWSNTTRQSIRLYGFDPNEKYNFTFFGSRASVTDDRTTVYTLNGQSVSLNTAGNRLNTVSLLNMLPAPDGTLVLDLKNGGSSQFSYLNALVIEHLYDDHTIPAKPRNFATQLVNAKANLSWVDAAYNETGYEIYRSTDVYGPYTLLNPAGGLKDAQLFADSSLSGNKTYYYTIRAVNGYGNSDYSDTLAVATSNISPAMGNLSNLILKNDQVFDLNVTATDDVEDVITLSVTGLPKFASFTDNGNGTGVIHLTPSSSDLGNYKSVVITAKDDKGGNTSKTISITVYDKDINSVFVNFNLVNPSGAPWNNFNNTALAGRSIVNLKDEAGVLSGETITLVDAFEGANSSGAVTGNNSGIYPDDVMSTSYYESSTTAKRIRITGLITSRKYNLVFFGSRVASDNRTTVYTSGTKSVSLNAAGNTSNTVQINGLVPDASGTIEFSVAKGTGSSFAYINALVIQSYVDNGTPLVPSNLLAAGKSKSSIQLNWNDKSDNETGFQIFRSTSQYGTYSLVNTVGANVTTYTDQGLQTNTMYFYKIRAALNTLYSSYGNLASASTFSYRVFVNFNRDNPASVPWNNTNNVPQLGSVYENLNNDQLNPTGLDMSVVKDFSGENPFGMITGNNSGVYPDNVIRSTWWVDVGVTAQLKISGLSQAMAYSFVFFGSRDGGGDRTSVYTVNGKSVSLNCAHNISQTVQIDNIRADDNGEAVISISLGSTATFAYIGALVIQGSKAPDSTGTINSGGTGNANLAMVATETDEQPAPGLRVDQAKTTLLGFPNPFNDELTVTANFIKPQSRISVRIMDLTGRLVYLQNFGNISQNTWKQKLNLSGKVTQPGIYMLQVMGSDAAAPATFKLIKLK